MMLPLMLVGLLCTANEAPSSRDEVPPLSDVGWRTACGPIACHVALRVAGVDQPLGNAVADCGWKESELTHLQTILKVLQQTPDIEASAVRISPEELARELAVPTTSAILPVRKGHDVTDHVICVIRPDQMNNFVAIDYPGLARGISDEDLTQIWDGEAIIVRQRAAPTWKLAIWGVIPGLLVGWCGFLWKGHRIGTCPASDQLAGSLKTQ